MERKRRNESTSAVSITQEDSDDVTCPWTQEQIDLVELETCPGDLVCVNALAGCGKTTTIALLCNQLQDEEEGDKKILYLVFGKKAQEEARTSNKFPKNGMTILTSHAFVRKHFFGENFMKCEPVAGYDLDEIVSEFNLEMFVRDLFENLSRAKQEKRAKTITRYIEKTLYNFQASADREITSTHVYWLAKRGGATKRTLWREKVPVPLYVSWATQVFRTIQRKCTEIYSSGKPYKIPHDAYMKVAQLEGMALPFHVIAIDEAQDMTPCQANLFWSSDALSGKVIYLFGDVWQQLYRFRGASDSFKAAKNLASAHNMSLTGSFRFGQEIARLANLTLQYGGGERLEGRTLFPGKIKQESEFSTGVVICRSNNGMYSYPLYNGTRIDKWTFLKPTSKAPQPTKLILSLESFLQDPTSPFKRKGETFKSIEEICEYCEEGEDPDLQKSLILLDILMESGSVSYFYGMIRESFVPLGQDDDVDDFDGVVLTTCHGAKGLEFDNVYIHNDFCFEGIVETTDFLNRVRLCDEINTIYVAVTRAKKKVCLSQEARAFFEHIDPNPFLSSESLEGQRLAWDAKWLRFESSDESIESKDDIPWPSGPTSNNPFCLDRLMSEPDQRTHMQKMTLRFHPDKFLPKHQDRIQDIDDEEKKLIVSSISQNV